MSSPAKALLTAFAGEPKVVRGQARARYGKPHLVYPAVSTSRAVGVLPAGALLVGTIGGNVEEVEEVTELASLRSEVKMLRERLRERTVEADIAISALGQSVIELNEMKRQLELRRGHVRRFFAAL